MEALSNGCAQGCFSSLQKWALAVAKLACENDRKAHNKLSENRPKKDAEAAPHVA